MLWKTTLVIAGISFMMFALATARASLVVRYENGIYTTNENTGFFGCLMFIVGAVFVLAVISGAAVIY